MMSIKSTLMKFKLLFGMFFGIGILSGQDRIDGPLIQGYGATFEVPNQDFNIDTSQNFYAVFDIAKTGNDVNSMNSLVGTIARFLNMHAHAGIPKKNLKVAAVFHNLATKDALTHEAYQAQYGVNNPNLDLIQVLKESGVEFFICGQSMQARGVSETDLNPNIQIALSALTILIDYQRRGYQLISFNY